MNVALSTKLFSPVDAGLLHMIHRYEDPAVVYQQVYLAHSHHSSAAAAVALFDLAKLVGFWDNPADAAAGLIADKFRRRARAVRKKLQLRQKVSIQQQA